MGADGRQPAPPLARALAEAQGLLFVCSGNMVRSAFAHLLAEHLGLPRALRSAATTYRNDRVLPETEEALVARGVARARVRAFRPTHLDDVPLGELAGFLALAMTRSHAVALARRPDLDGRIFLLGEARGDGEIADPVLEGADFQETFRRVARCVERLAECLERR